MPWRQDLDLSAFDPETVHLLSEAFDEAWKQIEGNDVGDREAIRLKVAKHIVEHASQGERDMRKLVEHALHRQKP